jgi:Glutathione S-transferase N-terminal domain
MATSTEETQPPILLYTMDHDFKQYGFSPFATKLRFRLRHAGVHYKDQDGDWLQAPKKKIPYVKFTESKEMMGDSALIIERMAEKGTVPDLNRELSPVDAATDLCLRSLIEDRLYFLVVGFAPTDILNVANGYWSQVQLYERWNMAYPLMRDHGPFGHFSWGFRHAINSMMSMYARGGLLWGHGAGRHSTEEVVKMAGETLDALNAFAAASLAKTDRESKEPFWILGREKATEADFTLYGALIQILGTVV